MNATTPQTSVEQARAAFNKGCQAKLRGDEYEYYRQVERGFTDAALAELHKAYVDACQAFYDARGITGLLA